MVNQKINYTIEKRRKQGSSTEAGIAWSDWYWIEMDVSEQAVEKRLGYWQELNDYAVSQAGNDARCEFRAVPG